jgi:predicted nuclease of predicted toxin-antitoxin system
MAEIRYHLDEHMDAAVAVGLRRRGIDASTTVEVGMMRATDAEQLAFARSQQRVFVTRDRGILASIPPNVSQTGIAIARTGRRMIGPTVFALARLHRTARAEDMIDRIEYL